MDKMVHTALNSLKMILQNQQITSQNISNASVVGYRRDSNSEFGTTYLNSEEGLNTRVFATREIGEFSTQQGDLESTENPLDVAIKGEGYFIIQPKEGEVALSRRGDFKVDVEGQLVNGEGSLVLGEDLQPIVLPPFNDIQISSDGLINIKPIEIRKSEILLLLGVEIKDDFIITTLEGLGFKVSKNNTGFNCIPPASRPDVTREVDVIEEIARIYGYDNIPADHSLYGDYSFGKTDPNSHFQSTIETLSGFGFHQIYSNSLQSEDIANFPNENSVPMMNPLNKDMSFLRTSLLPGLVRAANHNIKNSTNSFKLYELDSVHTRLGNKINDIKNHIRLSGIIVGNETNATVHTGSIPYDIYSIKGYVYALLNDKLHFNVSIESADSDLYDKTYNIIIEDNIMVGTFGKLSEKLFKLLKVDKYDIYGFDLDIEEVVNQRNIIKYTPINLFPKISRRINLVLEVSESVGPILEFIELKCYKNLIEVYPVEIFEDKNNVGKNKKSVTFEMVFQDIEKTLEDKDVNPIIDEIIDIAEKDFNAKLRL